ncbi:MAG: spore coat protein [Firmicutes bacterium]|jgi:spore coat protein CotF|nr:spore coat protein [Bacillota bacterium]
MLTDRDMFLDVLCGVKHEITDLTKAAMEASDDQIRQSFMQYRDKAEQVQLELVAIGTSKGWYVPAPPADQNSVNEIRSHYENVLREVEGSPVLTHV